MSNANQPLPYTDDVETIPADEAKDIERVVQAMKLLLARTQAKSGEFRADVHVKAHGYVQGELRMLPDLPAELAQGLFERAGVYRSVVRFSNAASEPHADAVPDGRGMAIKVLGVTGDMVSADEQGGPTQDFLMINHRVFFARNAKDFLRLERVLVEADNSPLATAQGALTRLFRLASSKNTCEVRSTAGRLSHISLSEEVEVRNEKPERSRMRSPLCESGC